jgi:hypothetical protein
MHSISVNPYWYDPSTGVEDFHPLSVIGRCTTPNQYQPTSPPSCSGYAQDGISSRTIDKGEPYPYQSYSLEPNHNGRRVNQGSYGDTAEASLSRELQVIVLH